MRRTILYLSCALFFSMQLWSQNQESIDYLKMTQCDFEPDAPAVTIFDKGSARFIQEDGGFIMKFERHKRVKIFKEAAFDQANFSIELYIGNSDRERVRDIKATTFFVNNGTMEKTVLKDEQIFEEPINKYWYRKKFALPNIKEGCILDVKYTILSPFMFHLPDWEFQSNIPTIYSEYKTSMIPFYTYMFRAQGFTQFDHFSKDTDKGIAQSFMGLEFQDLTYTFGLKNVGSFKDESFISSREDYIKKIDFQLSEINYPDGRKQKIMTTWPELSKDFLESAEFGKYIKKAEKIGKKEFVALLNASEDEKVEAILNHMKYNYKHNGYINKWAAKSIKEFTTEKTGNTANINLMALGYLRSVGINADPVIISTRDHGKINSDFPFSDLFNNVIILARLKDKEVLLDATDAYCPNNMMPESYYNGNGYLVKQGSENWITIKNNVPSVTATRFSYKLDPEKNELTGKVIVQTKGYESIKEKKSYERDDKKFKENLHKRGLNLIGDINIAELEENTRMFNYDFSFNSKIDQIDGLMIFKPFMHMAIQSNPFKQEERELNIDLINPLTKTYLAEITIPEGYQVEQLPEPINKNTDNTAIAFNVQKEENKIVISAVYQLKKPTYPASAYNELKSLYKTIIEKLNQKIVVSKPQENMALN